MQKEDLQAAIDNGSESDSVEFKSAFNKASAQDWVEIIKDIVAMANSGGGLIIFGVTDNGVLNGMDCSSLITLDPAEITDKVHKYTERQFHDFELVSKNDLFAIVVRASVVPLVFSKPGTYDVGGGKQKTAFSTGTIYFRHGAKSEPGNSEDLRLFVERRIEEIRKSWIEGIVRVVEAPPGSQVHILPLASDGQATSFRLVNDPAAPALSRVSIDETHPYRQKEVVEELNKALQGKKVVKPFHIQCVRIAHDINNNPTCCYRQRHASARYSQAFVEWIISQYDDKPNFFEHAKELADRAKISKSN